MKQITFLFTLFYFACQAGASNDANASLPVAEEISIFVDQQTNRIAIPERTLEEIFHAQSDYSALLPTLILDEFSVNKDTRLGPVLRALARIANVNVAFGDSVENLGPFRFRLNNPTPWNEVLESILGVYHLTYEVRGEIITILTLNDVSQRYELEKQKSDKLDLILRQQALSPLSLSIINIKYAKAESLVEPLTKVLQQSATEEGSEFRGSISADKINNNLILHAPPTDIFKLTDLIRIIDQQTRQVRIEASLVEVGSSFAYELGVKWSFHGNGALSAPLETRTPAQVSPMQMDDFGGFELSDSTYKSMQGIVDTVTGDIDYGIIGRDFALGMNLQAMEEDGKLKILSRPSLTTMDNQSAIIKSGSDIPYRTVDQFGNPVVEYKEAVLSLDVLPHIVDDVAISMDISITKDEPDFTQTVEGNPVVIKKYVQTRMMVLDGQTAVIGGLTKNSRFDNDGGIPFLRSIPFIGRLFSSKKGDNTQEELMIFLTPRIVPESTPDNSEVVNRWMNRFYYDEGTPVTEKERNEVGVAEIDFVDRLDEKMNNNEQDEASLAVEEERSEAGVTDADFVDRLNQNIYNEALEEAAE